MPRYFNINYELNPASVLGCIDQSAHAVAADALADRVLQYDFPQLQSTGGKAQYVCVADGNILQMVHRDLEYRAVVNGAIFSICDSSWVPLFLRLIYGIKVPQYCGSQIFRDLISAKKYRMYFLGSKQSILNPLKNKLSEQFDPNIALMTFEELPFLPVEKFDYPSIAERINKDNPDIIWVSLGAPKQEIFMRNLQPYLNRGVMIAVGAAFKFYSGVAEKRAPEWIVKSHLEFLYRIFQEPKKQLKRCRDIISSLPSILIEEIRKKNHSKNNR